MSAGHSAFPAKSAMGDAPGLTKRELIAAMAMQGLLARGAMVSDRVASLAVTQSDALLAELAKDGAA